MERPIDPGNLELVVDAVTLAFLDKKIRKVTLDFLAATRKHAVFVPIIRKVDAIQRT